MFSSETTEHFERQNVEPNPSWSAIFKVSDAGANRYVADAFVVELSEAEWKDWPQLGPPGNNRESCFMACMLLKRMAKVGFPLVDQNLGKLGCLSKRALAPSDTLSSRNQTDCCVRRTRMLGRSWICRVRA